MIEIRVKRENFRERQRRESLNRIFQINRVQNREIDQLFSNLLQNYTEDIYGAIKQLNEYKNHPDIDQRWFSLLYECFKFLDESHKGFQLFDLILHSVKQYYQGIISFVENKMLDVILKYNGIQIFEIIEILLSSQALTSRDFDVNKLVEYIGSYISEYKKNLFNILKLLSNNLNYKKPLIENNTIMNMLLSKDYEDIHQRSKIMNSLSRGNLDLLNYFKNSEKKLNCLFYLNLKQCLKIIFRILCYDEYSEMRTIMRQENIHSRIENLQYNEHQQNKEIIENILLQLD